MSNIDLEVRVVDKTQAALGRIDKRIQGLDKSMASINSRGSLLVKTLAGIATGMVVRNIINTTARFEDLRTTLTSVTGSAEASAEAFSFIQDFATRTQFGVEDLTRTFIKLTSNGIEPSEKLLTRFTDAAAVTTDQIGSLTALTDFYTRSLGSQMVQLMDLERLSDRGLPVYDIIKEKLGITRGEIGEFSKEVGGTIKIVNALGEGIDERFGGATQARIGNLSTKISNFQIALTNAADILGQGFSEALGDTIVDMTDFINANDDLIRQLGKDLGIGIEKSVKAIKGLGDEFMIIKDAMSDVIAGYQALPPFVKDVGIIGALLLGTKGRLVLVALLGIIGSINKQIDSIMKTDFSIDPGLEGEERLKEINKQIALIDERLKEAKDLEINFVQTPGGEMTPDDLGLGVLEEVNALTKQRQNLEMDAFQTSMALTVATDKKSNADKKAKNTLGELTEETLKNTDVIKGNKDIIDSVLESYNDMIKSNDRLIIQDIGTPLEEARKEYEKIKKAIGDVNKATQALDPSLKEERDIIRQLKEQLPGLNDSLLILEERMLDLSAMESPFFEFGQHIKEQADMMKQLGRVSTQVYDRMANDLTDFVMTGKFDFADFSRFVIRELVKIAVQAALTFAIKTAAGAFGFSIPGLAEGGPVRRGNPYVVGEQGPELFVPQSSGRIVPNDEITSGMVSMDSGAEQVNINFNITATDASSFDELLITRRATIIGIINEGMNRQGKRSLM